MAGAPLLACLALFLAPGAAAKEPQQTRVFGTELSLVSLPVFVSGDQGRAWPGLLAEDFELFDDGRSMPIVAKADPDGGSQLEADSLLRVVSP